MKKDDYRKFKDFNMDGCVELTEDQLRFEVNGGRTKSSGGGSSSSKNGSGTSRKGSSTSRSNRGTCSSGGTAKNTSNKEGLGSRIKSAFSNFAQKVKDLASGGTKRRWKDEGSDTSSNHNNGRYLTTEPKSGEPLSDGGDNAIGEKRDNSAGKPKQVENSYLGVANANVGDWVINSKGKAVITQSDKDWAMAKLMERGTSVESPNKNASTGGVTNPVKNKEGIGVKIIKAQITTSIITEQQNEHALGKIKKTITKVFGKSRPSVALDNSSDTTKITETFDSVVQDPVIQSFNKSGHVCDEFSELVLTVAGKLPSDWPGAENCMVAQPESPEKRGVIKSKSGER